MYPDHCTHTKLRLTAGSALNKEAPALLMKQEVFAVALLVAEITAVAPPSKASSQSPLSKIHQSAYFTLAKSAAKRLSLRGFRW